jgi:hypothetical protein
MTINNETRADFFLTENMFGGISQPTRSQDRQRCCPETTPKMIHKIEVLEQLS